MQFEELESSATEDEIAAEKVTAKTTTVASFTRKRPARKPFPEHLPREQVIVPGPTTCQCCGGNKLRKLGETITETLESIPRQWKVIQHVREKFTCRECEKIEYNFGHGETFLAMTLAALNLLVFAWHSALDLIEPPWQAARQAAANRSSFFAHILTLTTYVVFPSWQAFLEALASFTIPPELFKTQKIE